MKQKILNVFSILLGLMLLNGGLNKLLNYIPIPPNLPAEVLKDNAALMEISWLLPLIAVSEIIGGILIIIPKTRALGVLVAIPVMLGMLLTHIFTAPEGLPIAILIWTILLWNIFEHKHNYLQLIK